MVIDIQDLHKCFGSFKALNNLSLQVKQGEVHGFLGPNGSGKSTTIRVILGLLRADAGQVSLLGGDPWKEAAKLHNRLAYVPGDVSLWPNLSGGEAIDLLGNLRGGFSKERRARLIERFELDPTKKSRTYSKGNRQKVAIIAALCADVELLVLDEPTSGLDPLMEKVFQEEILEEKSRGKTVLLSSHIMSEVEVLADRVSIIREGQILQTGTLNELQKQTQTRVIAHLKKAPVGLEKLAGVHNLSIKDRSFTASVDGDKLDGVLKVIAKSGVENLICEPPSLEELFLQHYDNKAEAKG